MKIILALFISFACAAEFSKSEDKTIEKAPTTGFDSLGHDVFYWIVTYLEAREVLGLKILSRDIYHKVRRLWPQMELSTVDIYHPGHLMDFSHSIVIHKKNGLGDQGFSHDRAQLRYLREFSLIFSRINNLQPVIDLLPRDSLIRLMLHNTGFVPALTGKIDLPRLVSLKLCRIKASCDTFNSLPSCMRVLKMYMLNINAITFPSLVLALNTMDRLDSFSLHECTLPENGFSIILKNLPTSLRKLNINYNRLLGFDESLQSSLKGLREMRYLQKIAFSGVSNELALGIISNMPECITHIECDLNSETLNAFQQRSNEFTNVKRIRFFCIASEFLPIIQKIFPNLDNDIKSSLFMADK